MATLEDIAQLAGASKSTVSLVLNGKAGIGAGARERVLRAAESLGYSRRVARGSRARAGIIRLLWIVKHGCILNADHRGFVADYLQGLEKAAQDQGYRVEVMTFEGFDADRILETMGSASGAVVLATELDDADMARLARASVPLVFLDSYSDSLACDFVDMDNTASVHRIVEHLVGHGHRRVGLVQGRLLSKNFALRERALVQALGRAELTLPPEATYRIEPTFNGAFEGLLTAFAASDELPTALFCVNDVIAYGAVKALVQLGVAVPERVSVVGFDNLPSSDYSTPPLTSVAVSKTAIGARAFQLLKARMDDPSRPNEKVLVGGQLVVRQSVHNLVPPEGE